jgi:ribosomal protein L21E
VAEHAKCVPRIDPGDKIIVNPEDAFDFTLHRLYYHNSTDRVIGRKGGYVEESLRVGETNKSVVVEFTVPWCKRTQIKPFVESLVVSN